MIYTFTINRDHIRLSPTLWTLVQDGISYDLDPAVDSLQINNTIVALIERHQAYLLILEEVSKLDMPTTIPVSIHSDPNESCTAFYFQENKEPLEISMSFDYLLSAHNWQFALAHEFYHYVIYKYKISPSDEERQLVNQADHLARWLNYFMVLSVCALWIGGYVNLALWLGGPGLFLGLFGGGYALAKLFAKWNYLLETYIKRTNSYFMEYECDQFAFNLFPQLDLRETFLNETGKRITFDTHPSNVARCRALLFKERSYPFFISLRAFKKVENWESWDISFKELSWAVIQTVSEPFVDYYLARQANQKK